MEKESAFGMLYIVSTPIGNMGDITFRAVQILKDADLIAAEDTRTTRNLLNHYGITTHAAPYHQHNIMKKTEKLIDELKSGKNIALVSDAGTPGISDPGHELIAACIKSGIKITGIPGANAMIDALVLSGLSTIRFSFEGFPPRHPRDRKTFFMELSSETRTMVFYESPHRIVASLKDMLSCLGNRQIVVVREATKMFEDIKRGEISEIIEHFTKTTPRGEFVIVLDGSSQTEIKPSEEQPDVESLLKEYVKSGMTDRDAVKRVSSERKLPRREVYQCMLKIKGETNEPF